jgi:hypothetical protein
MKFSYKPFLKGVLLLFAVMILIKTSLNGIRVINEVSQRPYKPSVSLCPPKTAADYKNVSDGDYLYAYYRYEKLTVQCKE